jgi:uncharacterized membrane protein YuzA (DUF378 family)
MEFFSLFRTPKQRYVAVTGVFLLVLGLSSRDLALPIDAPMGEPLFFEFLLWEVNSWTIGLWIALGAAAFPVIFLDMVRFPAFPFLNAAGRTYALVCGVVFTVLAVWGFIDGQSVANIFSASTANNITHAIIGIAGLVVGVFFERPQREDGAGDAQPGFGPEETDSAPRPATRR